MECKKLMYILCALGYFANSLLSEKNPRVMANLLDEKKLQECFAKGIPYVHDDWIADDVVEGARRIFREFEGKGLFKASGLSNTQATEQGFGSVDRTVCDIDIYSEYDMKGLTESAMLFISQRIDALQKQLSSSLERPSLKQPQLSHESYLSISRESQFLKRHLDERHEGLKNKKAWLLSSRRSISWLLYLTDPGWDKGGQFRAFPPSEFISGRHRKEGSQIVDTSCTSYVGAAGCHEGDLQIGWIRRGGIPQPVYMDAWRRVEGVLEPLSALYILEPGLTGTPSRYAAQQAREYITRDFDSDQIGAFLKIEHSATVSPKPLFFNPSDFANFVLIEDHELWYSGGDPKGSGVLDVEPLRGRLVLFDSVALAHEVRPVLPGGERLALAGWFHETVQEFPEDWD